MTRDSATQFNHFSAQNYAIIKSSLSCNCEPYEDVFTLKRWNALGYKILKGSKGIKINTFVPIEIKDDNNKVIKVITRPKTTMVFCRCQVEEYIKKAI
jgi:hypothetical protein